MKKKPTSRKPRSARSTTGTGRQKSGSHRQTATASSRSSRPATISLEGTLDIDMQAAEAKVLHDVMLEAQRTHYAPPPFFPPQSSETGRITNTVSPTPTPTHYDTNVAIEDIQRARARLDTARQEHRTALDAYHVLRPTEPKFPDAAQVLYLAGLELVKAADDLYDTIKEI